MEIIVKAWVNYTKLTLEFEVADAFDFNVQKKIYKDLSIKEDKLEISKKFTNSEKMVFLKLKLLSMDEVNILGLCESEKNCTILEINEFKTILFKGSFKEMGVSKSGIQVILNKKPKISNNGLYKGDIFFKIDMFQKLYLEAIL